METKELVFKQPTCEIARPKIVRITPEAGEVIKEVMEETGLSTRYIVSQMICFCADKYVVEKEQ